MRNWALLIFFSYNYKFSIMTEDVFSVTFCFLQTSTVFVPSSENGMLCKSPKKALCARYLIKHLCMEHNFSFIFSSFVAKNVASDIAEKLCESVSTKLEGKVLGTFTGLL